MLKKYLFFFCCAAVPLFSNTLELSGPKLKGKTLFWLDAHYSGGSTAKGTSNSAIRDEITAIKKSGLNNAIILIDNIREFQGKPENVAFLEGFPSIKELKELLLTINPDYEFWILGDMAIAYPKTENIAVSPLLKACTLSRLSKHECSCGGSCSCGSQNTKHCGCTCNNSCGK